jgi:hypothetical protein
MKIIVSSIAIFAIAKCCWGYDRDENYQNNENDTILDILLRKMELSDYIKPEIDQLGS